MDLLSYCSKPPEAVSDGLGFKQQIWVNFKESSNDFTCTTNTYLLSLKVYVCAMRHKQMSAEHQLR